VFTGDLVAGTGSLVIGPGRGELAASIRSLELLLARQPLTLYPGHGPVVVDGQAKLREYLGHRAEREHQVLDGLADGQDTIDLLLDRIYVGLAPALRGHAARNVQAHLLKLEDEGRVRAVGDRWHQVGGLPSDAG
jgi:glyoxylase-like metal-dependent hydrolase (beta-lactamase superfamily II)